MDKMKDGVTNLKLIEDAANRMLAEIDSGGMLNAFDVDISREQIVAILKKVAEDIKTIKGE